MSELKDAVQFLLRADDATPTTSLYFGCDEIGNSGAIVLAYTLRSNSTLTELSLYSNGIGAEGVAALADALCSNTALTNLILCCNEIGAEGAMALADTLRAPSSSLTDLILYNNKIGAEGAVVLAAALSTNSTITTLYLGSNEIGTDGAKALAGALRLNSTITTLYLGGNYIGVEGVMALADALCSNSAVTMLYLGCNDVADDLKKKIDRLLELNRESPDPHMAARRKVAEFSSNASELCDMENHGYRSNEVDGEDYKEEEDLRGEAFLDQSPKSSTSMNSLKTFVTQLGKGLSDADLNAMINNFDARSKRLIQIKLLLWRQLLADTREEVDEFAIDMISSFMLEEPEWVELQVYGLMVLAKLGRRNDRNMDLIAGGIGLKAVAAVAGPGWCDHFVKALKEHRTRLVDNRLGDQRRAGNNKVGQQFCVSNDTETDSMSAAASLNLSLCFSNATETDSMSAAASNNPSMDHRELQLEHCKKEAQLRLGVKLYQEKRVQEEGISYFISVEQSKPFHDNCVDLGTKQLIWNADRVKQAAAGDGSSLSGLLKALQWIVEKYSRGNECPLEPALPPPPAEISLVLKSPEARKALADRKLDGENEPSILHIVCRANAGYALQVSRLLVEDFGAEFDSTKDSFGRSARTIALANNNPEIIAWAQRLGTLLGRYRIHQPIHKSATCKVVSATDIAENATERRQVALKIVTERSHYERELEVRLVHMPGSGVDISPDLNRFQEAHALKLYRFHDEMDLNSDERVMCLVMPLAARSLDEIIRAEHVAGRELFLIKHFAVAAARALQHLHSDHGIVHADFNPRNIVRLGSQFNLIDFDSSVRIGVAVDTGKISTGYCSPEFAKVIFSQDEGLEELAKQRDDIGKVLEAIQTNRVRAVIEKELKSIENKIAQLEAGETDPPKAHPTHDIWSFGAVMYYMLTGASLFHCDDADNLVGMEEERKLVQWKGLHKDHLQSVLANCPGATGAEIRAAKDMLRKCLKPDPNDRPQSIAEVLRMPFLDSSVESDWTPEEKNSIRFLFSGPLVFKEGDELFPIEWLNFERERDLLLQGLKNAKKDIRLSFDAATVSRLQELAGAHCGCLHFTGHGHPTHLVFEDGFGGAHFLSGNEIKKLVPHREAFNFVFVAACHSQPIGKAFIDAGVPHVLCCEHESRLMDDAAAEFVRSFYCELAKGSTIKVAFDSASGAVHVGHGGESEALKYVLLPSDKDHDISIFDADDVDDFEGEKEHEVSLPAPPVDLEGRQICVYEIVSEVLSDSGKAKFIFLVGKCHTSRRYLLSAACNYIKDRLSTASFVDQMLYVKPNTVVCEDSDASLLHILYKQLIPGGGTQSAANDSLEDSICEALKGLKILIVFDGVGDADSLHCFLNSLCHVAGRVKVLLSAGKKPGFSYPAAETVFHVDNLCRIQAGT